MTLSDQTRLRIKTLYNALADRILEPGDPVYVAQLNAASLSGTSAVDEMVAEIDFQEGGGVSLFTGQRGTGKSTELKRLQKCLEDRDIIAFYVDLSEYLLLTKQVEISDFLIAVAGALSDSIRGDKRFDANLAELRYWERLKSFLATRVELQEITTKFGPLDIKAALKADPDFKHRLQEASRGHVAQIVRDAHDFFIGAVGAVRTAMGRDDLKVVLIVDSIERIRGVGEEAMKVYDSVRDLFFGHGEHLRVPLLNVVYTVPPYLSILASGVGSLMAGASVRRLTSTHVFKDRSRDADPNGLNLLAQVIAARYPEWQQIIRPEALARLALSSGGDLREFFRLVRQCLPPIRDDADLPLPEARVAHAEAAAKNEMLPIPADHLAWLVRISASHEPCLQHESDLPVLAHFLDNRLVMNYRNGGDWYDVHPLIRDVVDKFRDEQADHRR